MAAAMVWQSAQRDKCPGCGLALSETTDDDHMHEWEAHVMSCRACEARKMKELSIGESTTSEKLLAGVYVAAGRKAGA